MGRPSHEIYEQVVNEAVRHHREGRLEEAERAYRHALELKPGDPDVLQMFGVLLSQGGRVDEGVAMIRKAIVIAPQKAGYHVNLGCVLAVGGRKSEAADAFARAVELNPHDADARLNLAHALREAGRTAEAVAQYREAFARKPPTAQSLTSVGDALCQLGRFSEAVEAFDQAVRLRSDVPELFDRLGSAFVQQRRYSDAEEAFRRMLSLQPDSGLAWFNLGNALFFQKRYDEAIDAYQRCRAIAPSAAACHNLANALRAAKRPKEGLEQYRQLAATGHDSFELRQEMGMAFWEMGELAEAASCYRRALELKGHPDLESGLIYTLHFLPDSDPATIRAALSRWNERYARPLSGHILPHTNAPTPRRRLRVGYLGRHLGDHPVTWFLLNLLTHHDPSEVEVFCYCDDGDDPVGLRVREQVDHWRPTAGLSDQAVADQIRADQIDILVDVMMHAGNNRLTTFARKPAPVQVAYLAYPGRTGLETMDYRLSDPYLDPPGSEGDLPFENVVRLPRTFWCYMDPRDMDAAGVPDVGQLPADSTGAVTFGCLNHDVKINDRVTALWAQILSQIPGSRLAIHSPEGARQERLCTLLVRHDVDLSRVEFIGRKPFREHLADYNRIDIGLDPFPYPGGTTTLDALYMGVPVVTLAGRLPISRGGVSILSNLGLPSLIAWDADQYVQKAAALAGDLSNLRTLRNSLRERLRTSPLMDAPQFARDVENAYRTMWTAWCDGH